MKLSLFAMAVVLFVKTQAFAGPLSDKFAAGKNLRLSNPDWKISAIREALRKAEIAGGARLARDGKGDGIVELGNSDGFLYAQLKNGKVCELAIYAVEGVVSAKGDSYKMTYRTHASCN